MCWETNSRWYKRTTFRTRRFFEGGPNEPLPVVNSRNLTSITISSNFKISNPRMLFHYRKIRGKEMVARIFYYHMKKMILEILRVSQWIFFSRKKTSPLQAYQGSHKLLQLSQLKTSWQFSELKNGLKSLRLILY